MVASLYQMPVDPLGEISGHRPADYWGRNLLDHLIVLLPDLIADDGRRLLDANLGAGSGLRTAEVMADAGLDASVLDIAFFEFSETFKENLDQIRRVEEQSDAYHFFFGDQGMMIMYLLAVRKRSG